MNMAYIFISFLLMFLSSSCKSDDQLTRAKPLSPGDMLISEGGAFALGFFSPTSSNTSLYLSIWYHNIPERTVVWIANRDTPITTPSSMTLAITNSSDMVLSDSEGRILWTTSNTVTTGDAGRAYAALLNSGNLVLRSPNATDIWRSFDHPTDTILPTMRFLVGYKTQGTRRLIAWKSPDDPSTGDFSSSGDPTSPGLQIFIWHGTRPYCRLNMISGATVTGGTYQISNTTTSVVVYEASISTGDEFYFMYTVSDGSPYTRVMLDYTGTMRLLSWDMKSSSWTTISKRPTAGSCEVYASCGPFGYCDFTRAVPTCQCLDGFEPDGLNSSRGCRRKQVLKCEKENHFVALPGMNVPDRFIHVRNRSLDQCAADCRSSCSCMAYAYANLSGAGSMADPSRCLLWTGELVDTRKSSADVENLYIRLADSPAGKRRKKEIQKRLMLGYFSSSNKIRGRNIGFPFVSFEAIVAATDNFSDSNLVGRGGFGKVYKGMLEGGTEVAIKRLSEGSGQGIEEFKNEIVLFAKLQHKNLVRLLGCCIHGDERLLIYEYLPNKSLDAFIFDATRQFMLDWPTRFKIIKGVARGLLYLHQDSRLKIIHRDLKASNILLDTQMNPKISDFGIARIFGEDQQQANTNRVVGTYGYMSPEYVMGGSFSVKSDTYSFGVILLEIVSGLKISSPRLIMNFSSLTTYAWRLWEDGKTTELVDTSVVESCPLHEVLRCIHVGLLCVQDRPNDRPLMSSVMFMLENESAILPAPQQPLYFAPRNETKETMENMENSVNAMSITALEGR